MRALVTGGAGFIGSTLVDALLSGGHDVCVVDDLSRGRREQVPESVLLHELDISDPRLGEVVGAWRPTVVFHHAAQIDVRRSVSEPLLDTRVNVDGTVNVLQSCADGGVSRVVFASSGGAIYGDADVVPTPETHLAHPSSHYGAAKLCGETYLGVYAHLYGLEAVSLRYANVYGPRQDPYGEAGVVAIFADRLLRGQPATINGDGGQTRDYVYVDDVVRANILAATTPHPGAYNIGTGRETDVRSIYAVLARAVSSTQEPAYGPAKAGEQRRSCLDVSLAATRLGWRPEVSLDDGIARTARWFAARTGER